MVIKMYGISTVKKVLSIKKREKLSIRKTAQRFGLSTGQYINGIRI